MINQLPDAIEIIQKLTNSPATLDWTETYSKINSGGMSFTFQRSVSPDTGKSEYFLSDVRKSIKEPFNGR